MIRPNTHRSKGVPKVSSLGSPPEVVGTYFQNSQLLLVCYPTDKSSLKNDMFEE